MANTTTALVLESNGEVFLKGNNVLLAGNDIGVTMQIPTSDGGGVSQGDFWAIPVNNEGVVTGIQFVPYNLNDNSPSTAPHPYAIAATKIRFTGVLTNGKPDYWFVLGTSAQWAAASLPTASSLVYWCPQIHAQSATNADGTVNAGYFVFTLGVPTLDAGLTYYPVGYINDIPLTAASGSGYSTTTALLNFLNSNWNTFGSPAKTITWAYSPNSSSIIGTFTDSDTTDIYYLNQTLILTAAIFAIS